MSASPSRWIEVVSRPRLLIWVLQSCTFAATAVVAFLLQYDFALGPEEWGALENALPLWVAVKLLAFYALRLDRGWWQYVSLPDLLRLIGGNCAASLACAAAMLIHGEGFPISLYVIDLLLTLQATAGIRLATRLLRELSGRAAGAAKSTKPVFIYGAGRAGVMLLQEIRGNARLGYHVRGFIDDRGVKTGMLVQSVPVLGGGTDLKRLAERYSVSEVLIAIPSASGPEMAAILEHCHVAGVHCKTVPGVADLIQGQRLTRQIRDVDVEDLLGRKPVELDTSAIRAKFEGQTVLVTGAAGSIGSEICRQVARFSPRAIVAFDAAETPLFNIQQEMLASHPEVEFIAEIGSIQDRRRLTEVFGRNCPSVVYHAAAYKHVPMMESAMFIAVENNVFGTENLAEMACEFGVSDFVMISSDKAVRPTNIMGLTKRVAELLIGSMQGAQTKFVAVRFGNVLGSNGSVIPTFKKQIAAGGPVTVTHPDMRRYFMTIPEAVQLVLQASTMGRGGEVFVLDMGQPVRILDLARNLILLSGLRPGEDVQIEFTGVRPGEKLYEELSLADENTLPTHHPKIKVFGGAALGRQAMMELLCRVRESCNTRDVRRLTLELKELVPEYNPSSHVLRELLAAPVPRVPVFSEDMANLSTSIQ